MICLDLSEIAEDLRRRGINAIHDFLYCAHGCVEGLDIDDDFFPLWELGISENIECLERGDFAAIKNRRAPDWTFEPPMHMRAAAL
jgi:hypothetical protein